MRWVVAVVLPFVLLVCACSSDPPPRREDGGAFVVPDGGFREVGVREAGVDAGFELCAQACPAGEVCGCIATSQGRRCRCRPPGDYQAQCDPAEPATCQDGLRCISSRNGGIWYVCSDGRLDSPCSQRNTPPICTTALGCVCFTPPLAPKRCTCRDAPEPTGVLCDPTIPETCASGTCVEATGPGGSAYFACSDGSEGAPCSTGDMSCRTSLGCTCPVIDGLARCQCSEPSGVGGPCDPDEPGACAQGLFCIVQGGPNGNNTVCATDRPDAGMFEIRCDPLDPRSCPPGYACLPFRGDYVCQPQ